VIDIALQNSKTIRNPGGVTAVGLIGRFDLRPVFRTARRQKVDVVTTFDALNRLTTVGRCEVARSRVKRREQAISKMLRVFVVNRQRLARFQGPGQLARTVVVT